jgi:UDP-glucuronate 4-epimerase
MQTVLVTGGAGFIGSHLVERLLAQGRRVYCMDNFDPLYAPKVKWSNLKAVLDAPSFCLIDGDIRDQRRLEHLFQTAPIEAVVHLAARPGVRPSLQQPGPYLDVNIAGTVALLEATRHRGLKNFVFASASSVYGASNSVPFREEDAVDRPLSPYAVTKRSGELICHTYHHLYGVPTTCLRIFTTYGPRQRPDLAIHTFARRLRAGEPIPMFGDGTTARDYTHVDDIVDGIIAALDRPHPYEIINLGSGRAVPLRELIELLGTVLGVRPRIMRLPEEPGDVAVTCADLTKAARLLDYQPRVELREGLSRFCEWLDAEMNGDRLLVSAAGAAGRSG